MINQIDPRPFCSDENTGEHTLTFWVIAITLILGAGASVAYLLWSGLNGV